MFVSAALPQILVLVLLLALCTARVTTARSGPVHGPNSAENKTTTAATEVDAAGDSEELSSSMLVHTAAQLASLSPSAQEIVQISSLFDASHPVPYEVFLSLFDGDAQIKGRTLPAINELLARNVITIPTTDSGEDAQNGSFSTKLSSRRFSLAWSVLYTARLMVREQNKTIPVLLQALNAIFLGMADCSEVWDDGEILRKNHQLLPHALSLIAHFAEVCGDYCEVEEREVAIENGDVSVSVPTNNDNFTVNALVADIQNDCGNLFLVLGEFDNAKSHYEQALAIRKKLLGNGHIAVASSMSGIGNALERAGRDEEAKVKFKEALDIYSKIQTQQRQDPTLNISPVYYMMGLLYFRVGDYTNSLMHLIQSLNTDRSPIREQSPTVAATLMRIGDVYCKKGGDPYNQARRYHDRAVNIYLSIDANNHKHLVRTLTALGYTYFEARKYSDSFHFFRQAVQQHLRGFVSLAPSDTLVEKMRQEFGGIYNFTVAGEVDGEEDEYIVDIIRASVVLADVEFATSLFMVGTNFYGLQDYRNAMIHFLAAGSIFNSSYKAGKLSGQLFPEFITTYQYIAKIYGMERKYNDALRYYSIALEVEANSPVDETNTKAAIYNSIGMTHSDIGDFDQALEFYRKALSVYEERMANSAAAAIDYVVTLNYIGQMYNDLREYQEGLKYHERALEISTTVAANNSAILAASYYYVGMMHERMGYLDVALTNFVNALEIFSTTHDSPHFDTYSTMSYMAHTYQQKEDLVQAKYYYHSAFMMQAQLLGISHIDTAVTSFHLATVLQTLKEFKEALYYFDAALIPFENAYGENHLAIATILNNMGEVFYEEEDFGNALVVFHRSLEIQIKAHGERHVDIATTKSNIGHTYYSQGNVGDALDNYYDSLMVREMLLGKDHPDTISTQEVIASLEEIREKLQAEEMDQYSNSDKSQSNDSGTFGNDIDSSIATNTGELDSSLDNSKLADADADADANEKIENVQQTTIASSKDFVPVDSNENSNKKANKRFKWWPF